MVNILYSLLLQLPTPSCGNQKYFHTLPNIPWWGRSGVKNGPWMRITILLEFAHVFACILGVSMSDPVGVHVCPAYSALDVHVSFALCGYLCGCALPG